jgi:hypothetical protein
MARTSRKTMASVTAGGYLARRSARWAGAAPGHSRRRRGRRRARAAAAARGTGRRPTASASPRRRRRRRPGPREVPPEQRPRPGLVPARKAYSPSASTVLRGARRPSRARVAPRRRRGPSGGEGVVTGPTQRPAPLDRARLGGEPSLGLGEERQGRPDLGRRNRGTERLERRPGEGEIPVRAREDQRAQTRRTGAQRRAASAQLRARPRRRRRGSRRRPRARAAPRSPSSHLASGESGAPPRAQAQRGSSSVAVRRSRTSRMNAGWSAATRGRDRGDPEQRLQRVGHRQAAARDPGSALRGDERVWAMISAERGRARASSRPAKKLSAGP